MKKGIFMVPFLVVVALLAVPALAVNSNVASVEPAAGEVIDVSLANQGDAKAFVQKMVDQGVGVLAQKSLGMDQKKAKFAAILDRSFDMQTIGKFTLGKYWNTASASEKAEYSRLFRKMVLDVYTARFSEYNGEKIEVGAAKDLNEKDKIVSSYIIPVDGGQKVQVDWRVRNSGGSYKVVDVVVAGVSMGVTQRSDFSSVIQSGGGSIKALLDYLRNRG